MDAQYSIYRGLFNTLCIGIIIGASYQACAPHRPAQAIVPTNYQQRFCDDASLTDYSDRNPDQITVTLREGCFGDHTKLPRAWSTYFIQKSRNQGDWAAVWCAGHSNPGEPRPYYEDMGTTFQGCHEPNHGTWEFFLQGRGTITFVRTGMNPEYAAQSQQPALQPKAESGPETAAQAQQVARPQQSGAQHTESVSAKQYKLTPISPEGGDLPDYVMLVKQCYRADQLIKCWGTITNTTDARTSINAYDSRAFDDEGNSISVYTFGGGFTFSGGVLYLPPSVPLKFDVTITDPHLNVKTIDLDLNVAWDGRHNSRVFKNIPVQ